MSEKLGCLEWWWLGVFIALNHHIAIGEDMCLWAQRRVRCATGHCPVRQPCHPTVRVLKILTIEALTSCRTRQVLFTVRCTSGACFDFCAHCSHTVHTFADDHCAVSCCSAWCTGQSGGTPDSPVAHRTVWWIIEERALRNPKVKSSDCTAPSAPDTVRWHTGQSGTPDQSSLRFLFLLSFWTLTLIFLLVCVEPLCTCRI
jgi:hypothetical protein